MPFPINIGARFRPEGFLVIGKGHEIVEDWELSRLENTKSLKAKRALEIPRKEQMLMIATSL
jgi:hypothetical protein